jgi:hypothetical protein
MLLLAAFAIAVESPTASVEAQPESASDSERPVRWGRFTDREVGLSFQFPGHIFSLRSATAEMGGTAFSTPDGRARILVFGFMNTAGETPRRHLYNSADFRAARFTYVRTTPRFFVASGIREDMIFYRRCNFSTRADKRVGCFHVEYPRQEKRRWDSVVTRMSLSLRTIR